MACKIEKNDRENANENISMRGTGEPMREFIFTDNLVDAMLLTLERGFSSQAKPINIGSGSEKNISAPADLNKAEIDFKEEIRLGPITLFFKI
jgi:nucleoside-diphosphate-sugar epimerase